MPITLHHVALASPKAADAASFYEKDWGLHEAGRDGGAVRLGAASDHGDDYSLVLLESGHKAVDHFCLVSDDEAALGELARRLTAGGVRVLDGEPACPGIAQAFRIADVDGRRVELGYRPPAAGSPPAAGQERDAVPGKPGHIVLNTPDITATTSWYQEKLGLGVRDWRAQKMSFLYCNEDHHTVAFNAAPHVSLNHVAYELADINQFFRAVRRASATTLGEKLYGPGRHGPGDYIFCYFLDPMGFVCEYETGGLRVRDPADYPFRVWEYSPESADQWLGLLSGGVSQRFRKATLGEPDPGVLPDR